MGGLLRIADFLQHIPTFCGLAVGVHFIDVNAANPAVLRVVVEQINEIDMRSNVITVIKICELTRNQRRYRSTIAPLEQNGSVRERIALKN
jgi:hypothetical protein